MNRCACGCGSEIGPRSTWAVGHNMRVIDREERFWRKVKKTDLCWLWTGTKTGDGYGSFKAAPDRRMRAHRFAYELLVGPIPEGLVIDHLCRNRACVNPDHLEAVTHYVNVVVRGTTSYTSRQARKTHCKHGHPFDEENTYIRPATGRPGRDCLTCRNIRNAQRGQRAA